MLFRTNEQPRIFETELRRKLPYVLVGTSSFFDRREVRDLMAYLKVLAQPADEMSLLRIINVPTRGIGEASVEKLLNKAVKQKVKFWDIAAHADQEPEIPKGAAGALKRFHEMLGKYGREMHERPKQMGATFRRLIEEIDYEQEIGKQYKEAGQQMQRIEIIEQMAESLEQYAARTPEPNLAEFLEEASLTGRDDEPDKEEQLAQRGIRMMTLHSAKGLEFNRVYLVGLEEGILPHQRSLDAGESSISEERRLMYVGITRARDYLTITMAKTRKKWGKPRDSIPSRFLYEMRDGSLPKEVTEQAPEADPEADTVP
ncbi:MAG: ATP-dependent helicase [Planctomycetales bacterium]